MIASTAAALCCAAQVVFLGDGFTKGWEKDGRSVWDAEFAAGKYEAANLGADGETSWSLLKRIDEGMLDKTGAKVIVVSVGGEDFKAEGLSALDLILDVQTLIAKIRERLPAAKIVLGPVFPRGAGFDDVRRRRGDASTVPIRDFQNAKDILWCDINSKLVNADGTLKPEMFAAEDRFSAAGYAAWAKELQRFLDFALGYVKDHPYPQLPPAAMFPEETNFVYSARARFKRHFLTAKEQRYRNKRDEQRRRNLKEYDAVWVGDSITHFWELWNGEPTFNRLFKKDYEIFNLGFGGDDTCDCLWIVQHSGLYEGYKTKLFTLSLGSNNINEKTTDEKLHEIAAGVKRIVKILRATHPEAKVLLLPIIPKGFKPDNPYRRLHEVCNDDIKTCADGKDVIWVGELYSNFVPKDGVITTDILCDEVHPGKEGYRIWGETMLPYIRKYCGEGLIAAGRRTVAESARKAEAERIERLCDGVRMSKDGEAFPMARWRKSPVVKTLDGTPDGSYRALEIFQKEPAPVVVKMSGCAGSPRLRARAHMLVDLNYMNSEGPHEWGNRAWLDFSRPGRQEIGLTVFPNRPLRHLSLYVWADKSCDPHVDPISFELYEAAGDAILDGVPVTVPGKPKKAGFYVRDVIAESGYSAIGHGVGAKGLVLAEESRKRDGARFFTAELCDRTGTDRATTLVYAVPLPKGDLVWWDDLRRSRKIDPNRLAEVNEELGGECGRGGLTRWPIGAVAAGDRGIAIGVDPELPGFCRISLNLRLRVLFIAYDIGLAAPEKPTGRVGFAVFPFEASEGMRGALERYQRLFPKAHEDRAKPHGLWTAFYNLSQVEGLKDFGFRYNEWGGEIGWDDEHNILSLRYKEPCTWWMKITNPDGRPATYDECLTMAKAELAKGTPDARAWATSVFKDECGHPAGNILNKPWCNGIAWSMNAAPGIEGFSEFKFKQWDEAEYRRRYEKPPPQGWDGEYIDSSELACTQPADFDRAHFAAMKTPLCFSDDRHLPCVYYGLSVQEYMAEVYRRTRAVGRITLANATPFHWSWLVPQTDVAGFEIGWNEGGMWKPGPEADLVYWRALAGRKPYCLLMSVQKDKFPPEATEKYFKLSLAYGFQPGFQPSLFTSGIHCRDRELFKKYVPLCRLVSEAGWRPVNRLAATATKDARVEQFGERHFTVFNHGKEPISAEVRLLSGKDASAKDLVSGRELKSEGGVFAVPLAPGDVALLDLKR
mgnify:CR=1 FL=1